VTHDLIHLLASGEPPRLHANGTDSWTAGPGTLALLAQRADPGAHTLETGAGSSTIVLAAAGASHTAVSPHRAEHLAIQQYCAEREIDTSRVRFIAEGSERALPRLVEEEPRFDLIFIDGRHSFPSPVIDYGYSQWLLARGGLLVMDDIQVRSVRIVADYCDQTPMWRRVSTADAGRCGAWLKVAEPDPEDRWLQQPMNRPGALVGLARRLQARCRREGASPVGPRRARFEAPSGSMEVQTRVNQ